MRARQYRHREPRTHEWQPKGNFQRMPNAKPISEHLKDGTYRADRHAKRAKVERKDSAGLRAPSTLPAKWRSLWKKVLPTLEASWLAPADAWQLAGLVEALAIQAEAAEKIATLGTVVKNPSGHLVRNPWFGVWRASTETIRSLSGKLGLSPLDRARLLAGLDIDDTEDPGALFAEMLGTFQRAQNAEPVVADEW